MITLMASCYALSYLVSMVGYLDMVLAILVLVVLSLRRPASQLAGVALLGCLGVVVHEMYAIVFLPVTLVPYLLGLAAAKGRSRFRLGWMGACGAFALPWMVTLLLTAHRALMPQQIVSLKKAMLARVNFPAEPMVFDVYSMSGVANMRMMRSYLGGSWLVLEGLAMLAFLPTTVYFVLLALRGLRERTATAESRWLRVCIAAAVFAPLLMNVLAYDLFRWAALMGFNAMLAALAVLRADGGEARGEGSRVPAPRLSAAFRNAACLLIALNLASNVGMFAHEGKDFPFYQYWSDYVAAKHAHQGWIRP